MKPKILLINPPVYDFTAYDFWLKPYGLLRVGGLLRGCAGLRLFDFLDRGHPQGKAGRKGKPDPWGRGPFRAEEAEKPPLFASIPRKYHRFGLPRALFRRVLKGERPFDFALVASGMTYWYPGVREVMEDLRALSPRTRIVLGGTYASLCPDHASGLGADLVVEGRRLGPLWAFLGLEPDDAGIPFWEGYDALDSGVLRLSDGCPFRCTYCAVSATGPSFRRRSLDRALEEYLLLKSRGVRDVAFYDDALLFDAGRVLLPFLEGVRREGEGPRFHTPNALHARFLTAELACAMKGAGFETYFLGFESLSEAWQERTGGKVGAEALATAVSNLAGVGIPLAGITAYLILGHPLMETQELEGSIEFVHDLGVRVMLSEFSPVPGTEDFERCGEYADLAEPLWHNKTAFPIARLGAGEVNRLKELSHRLNRDLP